MALYRRLRSPAVLAAVLIVLPALFAVAIWPYIITLNMEDVAWADRIVPNDVYNKYLGGVVVGIRLETYVVNPDSYSDFIEITLRRFGYYFIPLRNGYSLPHPGREHRVYRLSVVFVVFGVALFTRRRPTGRPPRLPGGPRQLLFWRVSRDDVC